MIDNATAAPPRAIADGSRPGTSRDKLNRVDFKWYVVRSLPHQERKLADLFVSLKGEASNILEVYCPTHTTVSVSRGGKNVQAPLFAGYVFVLGTRQAVTDVIDRYYPEGTILYDQGKGHGRKPRCLTVPEEQMRMFKDFNENYAEQVIVLERPYTDYAFNPKTNEPNEIVKIVDGPLRGRVGYLARFNRERRLVFNMKSFDTGKYLAVSVPDVWSLHVVRLHNAGGDRQTVGTVKDRAADLLIGLLQGCGYGEKTLPLLYGMTGYLAATPSLVGLCQWLFRQGHEAVSRKIAQLRTTDAELLLNLARYEHDNPGYVKERWNELVIRPFLTPTSGVDFDAGNDEAVLEHQDFIEFIRKVGITEPTYYPSTCSGGLATATYYAHIGVLRTGNGSTLFANWDEFLAEYYLTGGKANEKLVRGTTFNGSDCDGKEGKLIASFRNFAPTLYNILTDDTSAVKAVKGLNVGGSALNVIATRTAGTEAEDIEAAKIRLTDTCVNICKEINSTVHLAVWRRYLRTVWLHE